MYSQKQASLPTLYINQKNEITFDPPKGKLYNAIFGERLLVSKGKKVAGLDTGQLQPRAAVGINRNGRWIHLVVVDGRETTTEGASFSQLADILVSYGVYTAMSFNGGGSSTIAIEGRDRRPRVLNAPVNDSTPARNVPLPIILGIPLKKS